MITFLIVYKHNSSISEFKNMKIISDGKIMEANKWKITDFSIINIIPVKSELTEYSEYNK